MTFYRPGNALTAIASPFRFVNGINGSNGRLSFNLAEDLSFDDDNRLTFTPPTERRITYRFRRLADFRLASGFNSSIGDGERNSQRAYPILRNGVIERVTIITTQRSSTTFAFVNMTFRLVLNGNTLTDRNYNTTFNTIYVFSYSDLSIVVREGDVLGIHYSPNRNGKAFTVLVEQRYLLA